MVLTDRQILNKEKLTYEKADFLFSKIMETYSVELV